VTLRAQEITGDAENQPRTAPFTDTQGQYLAYIATYTKLHRRPPAEADLQQYFGVRPHTVHHMIVVLTERDSFAVDPARRGASKCSSPPEHLPPLR
jgi:hypothetical protein